MASSDDGGLVCDWLSKESNGLVWQEWRWLKCDIGGDDGCHGSGHGFKLRLRSDTENCGKMYLKRP